MASLNELRLKIQGIKSIQQITKAMKMIAGVRLARLQKRLQEAKAYSSGIGSMAGQLTNARQNRVVHPLLIPQPSRRIGVVLIGADKGLCGAHTLSVAHRGLKFLQDHRDKEVHLFVLGRKMQEYLNRERARGNLRVHKIQEYERIIADPDFDAAGKIAGELLREYRESGLSEVTAIFNEARSLIKYEPKELRLLPIALPSKSAHSTGSGLILSGASFHDLKSGAEASTNVSAFFDGIVEPEPDVLLDNLLPSYFKTQVHVLLLNAGFSELAARLAAMDNASRNAQELIDALTLDLNNVRQSAITRELSEIVGTSEAMHN